MQPSKTILRLLAVSACMLFAAGCKGKVEQVKSHIWEGDKGLTLGKALDNYKGFEKNSWEIKKTANGKEFVEFTGVLPSNEQKLKEIDESIKKINIIKNYLATKNIGAINCYYYESNIESNIYGKSFIDGDFNAYAKIGVFDNGDTHLTERIARVNKSLGFYLENCEKLKTFYSSGNRMEVAYQFIVNEDKTIDISSGGCRTNKDKTSTDLPQRLEVLKRIYSNEPINGVCIEPVGPKTFMDSSFPETPSPIQGKTSYGVNLTGAEIQAARDIYIFRNTLGGVPNSGN